MSQHEKNELPKGWHQPQLKELFDFVIGGDWGKLPEYDDSEFSEVLCIRGSEFRNWSKDKGKTSSLRKVKKASLLKRKLVYGDLLIEISGGGPEQPVGRTVFIDNEVLSFNESLPKVCTNFLRLARPNNKINSKYLNYYLVNFYNSGKVGQYQSGSNNLRNLKFKEYETINVPLAPLSEQKRIVEKLDSLLAQVDTIQQRLNNLPDIIKRFRQSVLAAAVSGKLTEEWRGKKPQINADKILIELAKVRETQFEKEIEDGNKETKRLLSKIKKHYPDLPKNELPNSWVWTSFMASMEKVVDCHNKTAPYIDEGIPLIRTPDIRNGKISLNGAKYISQETYDYWSRRCPPRSDDIIFTREAPMGEAGIVPEDTVLCMGQRMMLLRPMKEFINPEYILLNILSLNFQERMNKDAIGTGVKHLRVADVEALSYPLAPFEEQTEIVRLVEQYFALADSLEKNLANAKQRVDNLTQSILAKAFKGELVPQNPNDEPADKLLERIKAAREEANRLEKAAKKVAKAKTTKSKSAKASPAKKKASE